MHCEFLAQFTQIADIRVRCLEAPTKFMVAPMHYYDRALDGLLISIASARKSINKLFAELNSVKGECHEKFNAAEKMYREVECDALCDKNGEASGMQKFIKQRKEKYVYGFCLIVQLSNEFET